MAIRPDSLNVTPEARRADEIADLKRRVSRIEAASAAGIQRVSGEDATEFTTQSGAWQYPPTGPYIEINVPSRDSMIIIDWVSEARKAGTGDGSALVAIGIGPADFAPVTVADGVYFTKSLVYANLQPVYMPYSGLNNGYLANSKPTATIISGAEIEDTLMPGTSLPQALGLWFMFSTTGSGTNEVRSRRRKIRAVVI